jgi:23S rRNA (pseudouridine1915-N3)-methyltransferase
VKVTLLVVGRSRGVLEPAVREYEIRAARYWKLEVVEVEGGIGRGGRAEPERIRKAEGARLRERIPEGTEVWALTRDGKTFSSAEFADELGNRALHGVAGVTFVVGGAAGLDQALLSAARVRLSLSPMTWPHAFARLLLAEQLYRAGTIRRNEPYHKGVG